MKFRSFGRTGWQVSEIAFGAWQIGGDWDDIDDKDSIDTLLYACERGINFVATAERRCHGKSLSGNIMLDCKAFAASGGLRRGARTRALSG